MGKYGRDIFHNASWNQNEKILQFILDYAREKDWGSPELLKMDNDGMNIFIMLPLTEMRKSCNCSSTLPERRTGVTPSCCKWIRLEGIFFIELPGTKIRKSCNCSAKWINMKWLFFIMLPHRLERNRDFPLASSPTSYQFTFWMCLMLCDDRLFSFSAPLHL